MSQLLPAEEPHAVVAPTVLPARTLNEYDLSATSPVKVCEVLVMGTGDSQVAPLSLDT